MWKAKLKQKNKNFNDIDYIVEYSDKKDSFQKTYKYSIFINHKERVLAEIERHLKGLNSSEELEVGEITLESKEITQAEKDQDQWLKDLNTLKQATELLELGVITESDKKLKDIKEKVKSNYKAKYLN